jgi:hypothetical protein
VILFATSEEHRYTHDGVDAERDDLNVRVAAYDELLGRRGDRGITYVLTDFDRLSLWRLAQAAGLYRELKQQGCRVLNDPAKVPTRFGLLRLLHHEGVNGFNAYRVDELMLPQRWPVFLRMEGSHSKPLSRLLHNPEELRESIGRAVKMGAPASALLIVEYSAEPVRPGLFRRLSVFRIGERLLGFTCAHEKHWIVKYGTPGVAPPELYEEEYAIVRDNPYGAAMRRCFDLAAVEYGRIDFGLVDAQPQIYEINTNPQVLLRQKPSPAPRRNDSVALFRENYLDALRELDAG